MNTPIPMVYKIIDPLEKKKKFLAALLFIVYVVIIINYCRVLRILFTTENVCKDIRICFLKYSGEHFISVHS